jgi:hypothetical protein
MIDEFAYTLPSNHPNIKNIQASIEIVSTMYDLSQILEKVMNSHKIEFGFKSVLATF